jgi:hypothetical protein
MRIPAHLQETSPWRRHKLLVSIFQDKFAKPDLKEKAEAIIITNFVDLLNFASANIPVYKKPRVYLIDHL